MSVGGHTVEASEHTATALSPDERTLLFAQMDAFTEDLMLVEKFR